MIARIGWKQALVEQLGAFGHEAWLDFKSSPTFRKAWRTAGAEQEETVAWIERQVADAAPDRHRFLNDFCEHLAWSLCLLMSPAFVNKGPNPVGRSVLDGLATAFGSIPEYSKSKDEALRRLNEITDQIPLMMEELARHGRQMEFISYLTSDKFEALLKASPIREGYLLPLLSMAFTLLAAFGTFERDRFNQQKLIFLEQTLNSSGISGSTAASTLEQVAHWIGNIDFEQTSRLRAFELIREMHEAISQYAGHGDSMTPNYEARDKAGELQPAQLDGEFDKVLAELNEMIGLHNVKREIISLANYIKVQRLRAVRNLKQSKISLHLVFSGNPGTGKTTVARIVARLYKALGVLSLGHLVETDRSGLVVGYIGQTATNTKKVVESALNGVLFIDEAYSLVKDAAWDFGPEAIETLLKLMEDHRERIVVIVAGYSDPMADFIASNAGLQSRFTRRIAFEDYSAEEMLQIFEKTAADHSFQLTPGAARALLMYFSSVEGDDGFGNGRGVRNTFENATVRHANRIATLQNLSDDDLTTLTEEDVQFYPLPEVAE
jgi:hypothetical protein